MNKFLVRVRELERPPWIITNDSEGGGRLTLAGLWPSVRNVLLFAAFLAIAAYAAGFRIITPADISLLLTVKEDLPDADSLPVDELRARMEVHSQAISDIEHLLTAPAQENLSSIASLGHGSNPLVLKGRVAALLSIIRMLGDAGPDTKAKLVDRLVVLFSAAKSDEVMKSIRALADLSTDTRSEIFDRGEQGVEELATMGMALVQRGGDMQQLSADVETKKVELQKLIASYQSEKEGLEAQINKAKSANAILRAQFDQFGTLKRECQQPYLAYAACYQRVIPDLGK